MLMEATRVTVDNRAYTVSVYCADARDREIAGKPLRVAVIAHVHRHAAATLAMHLKVIHLVDVSIARNVAELDVLDYALLLAPEGIKLSTVHGKTVAS